MVRNVIRGRTAAAIAASVEHSLETGQLAGGDHLPAIRTLARALRVSPVTVAAAYRQLRSRGLAAGDGRRGTSLRRPLDVASAPSAVRRMAPGLADLATGNPDPALLPPLGKALRSVSAEHHLYGGSPELSALAAFAAAEFEADGLPPAPVAVTSGGLDAIERVLREHLRVGDHVAIEDPTFPALVDLVTALGMRPVPVAIDDEGPVPSSFARALASRVRATVIASRAQNPTGAALTSRRVGELTRLLDRHPDTLVIEIDDAAAVAGAPVFTLSRGRAQWAVVKSTSKFLGPDLRLAVMIGDGTTIARVRRRQAVSVRWVSHILQGLALALWSDPSNGRLLARAAQIYAERRHALVDALAARGIAASGRSGFNVWIPVREETATAQALAERGWAVAAGERFRIASPPAIRVTTSRLMPAEAQQFAADLEAALRSGAAAPA
jgi:DNA-binding transcriptional MocR family regulator